MLVNQALFFASIMLAWNQTSYADKVDDIKKAINSTPGCENRTVADSDALRHVKDLFFKCEKGSQVDIDGCKVPCQRK